MITRLPLGILLIIARRIKNEWGSIESFTGGGDLADYPRRILRRGEG
jgi:hypothetical protein